MKKLNKLWLFAAVLSPLCACTPKVAPTEVFDIIPYEEEMITLQNLTSRILVYCYTSPQMSAEQCAKKFENDGFVRLKDIPKFPAEDDFLRSDTYPTRRWRKEDLAPRW